MSNLDIPSTKEVEQPVSAALPKKKTLLHLPSMADGTIPSPDKLMGKPMGRLKLKKLSSEDHGTGWFKFKGSTGSPDKVAHWSDEKEKRIEEE